MVDGPYDSREKAEIERKRNVRDRQCFDIDCSRQEGFVARVVRLKSGGVCIVERQ
jgi:hypothetical protein